MMKRVGQAVVDAQIGHALWIVTMVAKNIGTDFEGMLTVLRVKHAQKNAKNKDG